MDVYIINYMTSVKNRNNLASNERHVSGKAVTMCCFAKTSMNFYSAFCMAAQSPAEEVSQISTVEI